MANPQVDDGKYTRIANEILEAMMRRNFTSYQWRVLLVILRKTYGYQRKTDCISYSQFQKSTGIAYTSHIYRALKELEACNIITISSNGHPTKIYGFQKDYDVWLKPCEATPVGAKPIEATPTQVIARTGKGGLPVEAREALPVEAREALPVEANTKESIKESKETTTKKRQTGVVVVGFDFISLYERNFGLPLPSNKERLLAMASKYGNELIYKAVDEAVKKENKGIKYIEGIVKNMAMDTEWEASRK